MMKYIMFGNFEFVIFPDYIGHKEIRLNYGLVSAGFCMFNANKDGSTNVSVWGKSESLNLESRQEDAKIIQRQINQHLN